MEFEKLKTIIGDVLHIDTDDLAEGTTFVEDLGADSLDVFQIIMAIEEEFDIEMNQEAVGRIITIKDAVTEIKEAMG